MDEPENKLNIIRLAFGMAEKVIQFTGQARMFFYAVMLSGHDCPKCEGRLDMDGEGKCRCRECRYVFDPTPAFQCCPSCGGSLKLVIRRYLCTECGLDVPSRFLFEGKVFDSEYFRERMAESRSRREQLREQVRKMLAESRSLPILAGAADLGEIPGLMEAFDGLTSGLADVTFGYQPKGSFDLSRYQSHIQAHLKLFPVQFEQIPRLSDDARLDRVWRFIAMIFLANQGVLDIRQEGETLWVKKHEVDTEGSGIFEQNSGNDPIGGFVG